MEHVRTLWGLRLNLWLCQKALRSLGGQKGKKKKKGMLFLHHSKLDRV